MTQQSPANQADTERDGKGDREAPVVLLQTVDHVHTVQRGDEGTRLHDDCHRGQRTHRVVRIVVDDARIGVHRRFQDV